MFAHLVSVFLRVACACLWVASTAVICTGAAAVALVVALSLGEGGAMVIALALLVLAAVFDEGDPAISYAGVFVVSSVFFPVAVAAGYEIHPAVLLNRLFDAARDLAPLIRAGSKLALDLLSVVLEAPMPFMRSHLG